MGNMLSTIPDSIYSMEALKILDISNNQIGAISPAIGNAKLLVEFKCGGNAILSLPETIGECVNIETIELKKNKLQGLPASFGNLRKLTKLNVDEN